MATLLYKWLFLSLLPMQLFSVAPAKKAAAYHPFFVSVTEVHHNPKDKSLEISCKIFADDMEDVLKQNYKAKVDLTDAKQQAQNNQLVHDYIVKHLSITTDGKPAKLNYIGFEKESESVYCYFEVPGVAAVKKLELTNSILQDFTKEQINILHVTVNGARKSHKLDYPQKQVSFTF